MYCAPHHPRSSIQSRPSYCQSRTEQGIYDTALTAPLHKYVRPDSASHLTDTSQAHALRSTLAPVRNPVP